MRQIIFLLFLAFGFSSKAQDTLRVSRKDLLEKVNNANLQIKISEADIKVAKAELLQSRSLYLPNVNASYTFLNTNNPLMAFGSKLNQARVTMQDFMPDNLNHPSVVNNFATKLEVQQPIINMDGVYQKKAEQTKIDALQLKTERVKEYAALEITKTYLQLQLSYKALETLQNAKNTNLANKKQIDNYYKNGLIQKSDVLYMEVRVTEIDNQILQAKSNIQNLSDYISFLLNQPTRKTIYQTEESLTYQEFLGDPNTSLNPNRKDIQAQEKSIEANEWMIKSSKAKFLPRLNAFGSFEMYDKTALGFGANGYVVGLQLSWNVFDGLKSKNDIEKYKADIAKTQVEIAQFTSQNQLELDKSYRQIQNVANKVKLTQQAWDQTKEAYRIRKNRYDQGLEKSADLLTSETQMSQKELEYQQAVFEYNSAIAYYQFLK